MQVTSNHETTQPQALDLDAPFWEVVIDNRVVADNLTRAEAKDAAGPFGNSASVRSMWGGRGR